MHANKKFSLILLLALITLIFIPFFYFSMGPLFKKHQFDSQVTAYKVTFEDIYHEGGYDDEGYWEDAYYTYKPTYYYRVNRMEFTYTPNYSSSSKSKFKNNMKIYYDKHNPYDAMADSEINITSAVMVFGMYAMFMGTIGFLGYSRMRVSDDMNFNVNQ